MTSRLPRGIRNNNPGNLERTKDRWLGMSADQSGDDRFVVFDTPEHGIRALMRLLINYQERHGLTTVAQIITRWAPPKGRDETGRPYTQNTEAYMRVVADRLGVKTTDSIDLLDRGTIETLARAIVRHENGDPRRHNRTNDWYDDATYDRALVLAGFAEARKPLAQSRTVQGGAVAGAATIAAVLADAAEKVQPLTVLGSDAVQYAFAAFALLGIGAMIYARIDDWRRGRR